MNQNFGNPPNFIGLKLCIRKIRKLHQTSPLTVTEPNDPPIIFWYSTTTPQKNKISPWKSYLSQIGKGSSSKHHHFWQGRAVKLRLVFCFCSHVSSFHCLDVLVHIWKTSQRLVSRLFLAPPAFVGHHLSDLESPQPTWPNGRKKKQQANMLPEKAENFGGWAKRWKKLVV